MLSQTLVGGISISLKSLATRILLPSDTSVFFCLGNRTPIFHLWFEGTLGSDIFKWTIPNTARVSKLWPSGFSTMTISLWGVDFQFLGIKKNGLKRTPRPATSTRSSTVINSTKFISFGLTKRCTSSRSHCRLYLSSWYERTRHGVCLSARRCGRQSSRAEPESYWQVSARACNHHKS